MILNNYDGAALISTFNLAINTGDCRIYIFSAGYAAATYFVEPTPDPPPRYRPPEVALERESVLVGLPVGRRPLIHRPHGRAGGIGCRNFKKYG